MIGPEIETALFDLRDTSLEDVRERLDELDVAVETLLRQVERPRLNIGSSNPPGRAD